ncbi:MAG: hypothetical protein ACKKMV_03480 [Candidatus Nealsonbacteria bacterium]
MEPYNSKRDLKRYKVRKAINSMGVEMELIENNCYVEEHEGKKVAYLERPPIALYASGQFHIPERINFEVAREDEEEVIIRV